MHDSGESFEKPKCHEKTRIVVLSRLMDWILGKFEPDRPLMWLYGDAGAGKSAIAQTLAFRCSSAGHLLASFSFSRNDPTRCTHTSFAPTIAYQMGTIVPGLRTFISTVAESDPVIVDKSLELQFASLIVNPINDFIRHQDPIPDSIPHVIIIDGLDECSDPRIQIRILEVLSEAVRRCGVKLKILVASRPEVDISLAFNCGLIALLLTRLALDASFKPDQDIRITFESAFREIKAKHRFSGGIPAAWPNDNTIAQLVRKASGQFIYASTVINYISSSRHYPVERLEIVLGIRPPASDQDLPFAALDSLLTHLFSSITAEYTEAVLDIVACRTYLPWQRGSLNVDLILPLLCLDERKVELYLGDLSSILKWTTSSSGKLQSLHFRHTSVADFLEDRQRSRKFYIDKADFIAKLACMCLRHLNTPTSDINDGAVLWYFRQNIRELIANLTPSLRDQLINFSLSKFPDNIDLRFAVEFMHELRRKENAQDIYVHQWAGFDQYILSFMAGKEMRPNEGKAREIALIGLSQGLPSMDNVFLRWDASAYESTLFYGLPADVLVDFFEDPLRSGEFLRTGATYAAAALATLDKIFSNRRDAQLERRGEIFNTACHYLAELLQRASHSPKLVAAIRSFEFGSVFECEALTLNRSNLPHSVGGPASVQVVQAAEVYLKVDKAHSTC